MNIYPVFQQNRGRWEADNTNLQSLAKHDNLRNFKIVKQVRQGH